MTVALLCAALLASTAWAGVVLVLGRAFMTWAAAHEERRTTDAHAAAAAALSKRVDKLEAAEMQARQAGFGARR